MQLAIVAAGFSPGEADQLRRSMAAWRRKGGLWRFEERLVSGMASRGYGEEFARQIFQQILGFGEYGFPESHAASFALLVYVSAWIKCHHPAAFACALLNSQPMGFYAPSQLVQDARRHGVEIRPVDVAICSWDCTLAASLPSFTVPSVSTSTSCWTSTVPEASIHGYRSGWRSWHRSITSCPAARHTSTIRAVATLDPDPSRSHPCHTRIRTLAC